MLGGTHVGYARLVDRWWQPIGQLPGRARACWSGRSTSSPRTRTASSTCSRATSGAAPRRSGASWRRPATARRRPRSRRCGERGATATPRTCSTTPPGSGTPATTTPSMKDRRTRRGGRARHHDHRADQRLRRHGPGDRPLPGPARRPRSAAGGAGRGDRQDRRRDPERRLSARDGRLLHRAADRRADRGPARLLRAGQGRHAERGRRRRDVRRRGVRRAHRQRLLVPERVRLRRGGALAGAGLGAGPPEGGDGARDVPPEPRVPGAVLPRGVHRSWRWRPGRT